jgi:hypothetical protein
MRVFLLTLIGLTPLIQVSSPAVIVGDPARLIGTVSVLGSLTVLVYRLGIWRQEMENTKNNVGAEVRAYREQSAANFERIERRLSVLDRLARRIERLEQARNE